MYRLESWGRPQLPPEGFESEDNPENLSINLDIKKMNNQNVAAMRKTNGNSYGSCMNGTRPALDEGCWTVGLINSKFKYLSAECFGFRTNANGKALKKKQIWILEPSGDGESIILRSHMNKYIAVDQFGNVICDQDEKDDTSKFEISVSDDFSGRWAFKSLSRGYYLGANGDSLICSSKSPGDAELWYVHLAARPQVNLRSIGRKRFAHLSEEQDEIHVEENVPWGQKTLFTLEFREGEKKYAIHTSSNMYLQRDGKLTSDLNKECFFSLEYHGGHIALRDQGGQYLAPIGSRAVLKTRSSSVSKDELFTLDNPLPQACFIAMTNTKYVSVKQGVDLTANQDEISDHETFQMEFDVHSGSWYIRTMQDKYFTLQPGGGIQAKENKRSPDAIFDLEWHKEGTVSFKAMNGKYVATKKSGHLFANTDTIEDNAKYYFYLVNRPNLILKCDQGFVGYRSSDSSELDCNKANYETIIVEKADKGQVYLKGQNGKYIGEKMRSICAKFETPTGFYFELWGTTYMSIKCVDGRYLNSLENGMLTLAPGPSEDATQWEY